MKTQTIRKVFLDFFAKKGHRIMPSAPLVPAHDPTLLFTNAGMVPFKDFFLGKETPPAKRATSAQKCLRAGGKHNDLENVGYTARHHTFFEMLGNFSFGDYFKEEAISFAWEFLTKDLGLPQEKLWITVFYDDEEARALWKKIAGLPEERIVSRGERDNFWQMGDTGPCGPCTEVYYDHGPEVPGGPPGSPEEEGDRFVEIWNLVFMQFDRSEEGVLSPLPRPSVDTGMGLERISAVLQGVHSNYEIDLFRELIAAAARATKSQDLQGHSLRVIADHIRASVFLIAEGVTPSNEGRGHVLRRIIRRAVRHGYRLGQKEPFFCTLVPDVGRLMGDAYPEILKNRGMLEAVIAGEEERFHETLEKGMTILSQAVTASEGILDGETVFRLYDTYGFPLDLTADVAREEGLAIDMAGFERALERQRQRARRAHRFRGDLSGKAMNRPSIFVGNETLFISSEITALIRDGEEAVVLGPGDEAVVVLDSTPFYPEGGGQLGDKGEIYHERGRFLVQDTQRLGGGAIAHKGVMQEGEFLAGDTVHAQVEEKRRLAMARHHSATHLLHAALQKILGPHAQQRGSEVREEALRFDFVHPRPLSPEEIAAIEDWVNDAIWQGIVVVTRWMGMEEAKKHGALALFGEKYGETVRVVEMGKVSVELCGGTHVTSTSDVGFFKITNESALASGIRRIEAMAGGKALAWVRQQETLLREAAALCHTEREALPERLRGLLAQGHKLEKEVERLLAKLALASVRSHLHEAKEVSGARVLALEIKEASRLALRQALDDARERLAPCVVVLASRSEEGVILVAGAKGIECDAGRLAGFVAQKLGGRGGGRKDFGQGGGPDEKRLQEALDVVASWVAETLSPQFS